MRAPVTGGMLGTFSTITGATLATPLADFTAIVAGNRLYVIAGDDASGPVMTIEQAALSRDRDSEFPTLSGGARAMHSLNLTDLQRSNVTVRLPATAGVFPA